MRRDPQSRPGADKMFGFRRCDECARRVYSDCADARGAPSARACGVRLIGRGPQVRAVGEAGAALEPECAARARAAATAGAVVRGRARATVARARAGACVSRVVDLISRVHARRWKCLPPCVCPRCEFVSVCAPSVEYKHSAPSSLF